MRQVTIIAAALAAGLAGVALAQPRGAPWAVAPRLEESSGEGVYRAICQGCHMPDGQGAQGSAAYPALARNPRLEAAGYPITIVVHGQRAMPGFGGLLNDAQVAAVVAFIRTQWGNDYDEPVRPQDVGGVR